MNTEAAARDLGAEHDLLAADAIQPGEMIGVRAGLWHVLLLHTATGWHAMNDRCPHAAARLSPGRLRNGQVMCPMHGARFDPETGRCVSNAYASVRIFPVRVDDGRVIVTIPNRLPEMVEMPVG